MVQRPIFLACLFLLLEVLQNQEIGVKAFITVTTTTPTTAATTTAITTMDAMRKGSDDGYYYPTHRQCKTIDDTDKDGDAGSKQGRRIPLKGCDTFVAYPPLTPDGVVIFGKNSDRPAGEKQSITRYPAKTYKVSDEEVTLQCTYITIPQVESTYSVILSQIGKC